MYQFVGGDIAICIVGNKLDLSAHRDVSRAEAQAYAEQMGAPFVETSALTGEGADDGGEEDAPTILIVTDHFGNAFGYFEWQPIRMENSSKFDVVSFLAPFADRCRY